MRKCIQVSCILAASLAASLPGSASRADTPRPATVARPRTAPVSRVTAAPLLRLTPEARALLEIQESGRRQVEALAGQAGALPEGPARRELVRRAEALKLQCRVDVLRARAQFARARGVLAVARECEAKVERLLNPPRPMVDPATVAPKPGAAEGGAK